MTLQEQLEKLGLNQKAAQTYLAALELGSAPVQEIAKKAGMNRTSVYPQIEELIKLGLTTTVERGKKTFYAAEPPRQLDLLLRREELDLNAKRDELLKILPEFEALANLAPEKPVVKFYKGKEGLEALREDLLKDPRYTQFLSFTAMDDYLAGLPNFEQDQSDRREQKGIPIKVIYTYSRGKYNWTAGKLREVRFLPFNKFPFSSSISIAPAVSVQIIKHRKGYLGVLIESKELAQTMTAIFDLCWAAAEKYN